VSEMAEAKRMIAVARLKLGRLTKPGDPHHLVHDDWCWAHELMEARKPKLLAHPGVVGCGLGFRIREGERLGTPCLTVYVETKLPKDQLPPGARLPKTVRSGKRRLEVDVVELGGLERQVQGGDSIGPIPLADRGTLGAFARDLAKGDVVALTAMHVTQLQSFPAQGSVCPDFQNPCPGSKFGKLRAGTMTGIDAAMLELDTPLADPITDLPTIGRIHGWRPTTFPGDQNTPVRIFGASSGFQSGTIESPATSIPAASLDSAILVDIQTQGGDSGCALVDPQGLVLGFLVGRGSSQLNRLAVFTPASLVLSQLGCDIPSL
jgi:hypothetical protein